MPTPGVSVFLLSLKIFNFGSILPKGMNAFESLAYFCWSKLYEPGPGIWSFLKWRDSLLFYCLKTKAILMLILLNYN